MRRVFSTLIVLALVIAACGGSGGEVGTAPEDGATTTSAAAAETTTSAATVETLPAQTVASPDGRLTLEVPAGYPEVTVAELDIGAATGSELMELVGLWELGPDGTTFSEPVLFEFDAGPVEGERAPLFLVASRDGDGVFHPVDTSVRVVGDRVVVEAELDHFSVSSAFLMGPNFEFFPLEVTLPVGESFGASSYLTVDPADMQGLNDQLRQVMEDALAALDDSATLHARLGAVAEIVDTMLSAAAEPVADGSVVAVAAEAELEAGHLSLRGVPMGLKAGGEFLCAEEGLGTFGFDFDVNLTQAGVDEFLSQQSESARIKMAVEDFVVIDLRSALGVALCFEPLSKVSIKDVMRMRCEKFTTAGGFEEAECEGDSELTRVDILCEGGDCSEGLAIELENASGSGIRNDDTFSFVSVTLVSGDQQIICTRQSTGVAGCFTQDNLEVPSDNIASSEDGFTWTFEPGAVALGDDDLLYVCSGPGADVLGPVNQIGFDGSFGRLSFDSVAFGSQLDLPAEGTPFAGLNFEGPPEGFDLDDGTCP